jgi:NAD(P)-dependent dehydrogenase (short-subunit alcohol dehydrogenase family)
MLRLVECAIVAATLSRGRLWQVLGRSVHEGDSDGRRGGHDSQHRRQPTLLHPCVPAPGMAGGGFSRRLAYSATMTDDAQLDLSRFSLAGKVAVITGASKNIGAAIARGFAEAGADLLLVARGQEALEAHAGNLRAETGRRVETFVADVGDPGAATASVEFASRSLPPVDIRVNNAFSAGSSQTPILELDDSVWGEVLAVNLLAPYRLCKGFGPSMAERGGCSIINVVSGSGFLPTPDLGAYGVSKAALWMMTRYLAVEAAPGIRVNAICPGVTSPDGEPLHDAHHQLLPLVPMKRLGRADEMVGAAIYLASDAASYTTGEIIFANGGRPW